jgi:outer membrane lipoprotein-sorting protein
MRRLTISLVLAVFAITALSAQDLDKILSDHYKASAQDKMAKITSTSMIGKSVAMGMETQMAIYQARPNNFRLEVSVMGSKIINTYNGTTGWLYAPIMGVTEVRQMTQDELKTVLQQANMDSPLWDYKAKGNNIELTGTTEDGSAYMLKLTTAEADEMTICISKETFLISKVITTQMAQGMETEIEMEMKDYKVVKGIPTAHYMATKMGGQVMSTITFESIEYNKTLDSALFGKPVIE